MQGWARQDSNLGPRDYESPALTAELQARAIAHSTILYRFRGLLFTASKGPFDPIRGAVGRLP